MKLKVSRANDRCIVPSKNAEDAGYDIYLNPVWLDENGGMVEIKPNETLMIPTGIRTVIEPTHYAQIQERGSTGTKGMKYGAGVIDSSYRGEWFVPITNCSNSIIVLYDVEKHNKESIVDKYLINSHGVVLYPSSKGIAQFVLLEVPKCEVVEVSVDDVLNTKSIRGEGALGHSGK